jgi:glycosyltransferase involved in cell wall biosynthesis
VTSANAIWMNALTTIGEEVRLSCLAGKFPPLAQTDLHITTSKSKVWLLLRQIQAIKTSEIVWLISGWLPRNFYLAVICLILDKPYICVPHGAYSLNSWSRNTLAKRLYFPFERFLVKRCTAVHIFFEHEKKAINKFGTEINFLLAPTGLPISHFKDFKSYRMESTKPYFAWLGRYDFHQKGVDLLIKNLQELAPESRPRIIFHGRDSRNTAEELRKMVRDANLSEFCVVGGPIDDLGAKAKFLKESRGLLVFSRWESHPMTILESLSLGVPIIAREDLDITKFLVKHEAARSFKESNGASLHNALNFSLEESNKMGKKAFNVFMEKFQARENALFLIDTLRKML